MSNAAFYYFFPLILAGVFVVVGFVMFRKLAQAGREGGEGKAGVGVGCGGVVCMLVGTLLGLTVIITAPTPGERQKKIDRIFRTPPDQIRRIELHRGGASKTTPLVKSRVVIEDPQKIREIMTLLASAKAVSPNHPGTVWTCDVQIVIRGGERSTTFVVQSTGDANGTLIRVGSKEFGGGWNLGTFRADGLEKILEAAAAGYRAPR